jgi:signal peptidase II
MARHHKIFLFCICAIAFAGCDRVTKDLAKEHLQNKEAIGYLNNTIKLVYVENTGAAMSFADELPKAASFWLLSMLPLAVMIGLAYYVISHIKQMHPAKFISFALIIAGGLGNIYDRIVYDRHVTDFIYIGVGKLHTGIFNIADVCVSAGVVGILVFYNRSEEKLTISN